MLATYPNFHVDIAARVAELGRQPRAARELVLAHPDRVMFGVDLFPPNAREYAIHFRFLETDACCRSPSITARTVSSTTVRSERLIAARCAGRAGTAVGWTPGRSTRQGTSTQQPSGRSGIRPVFFTFA